MRDGGAAQAEDPVRPAQVFRLTGLFRLKGTPAQAGELLENGIPSRRKMAM